MAGMDRVTRASPKDKQDKHQRRGSKRLQLPPGISGAPGGLPCRLSHCYPRLTKGKDTSQAPQILLLSSLSEKQKGLSTNESQTQPLIQAESVLGEDSFI